MTNGNPPLVSVVVVCLNGLDITRRCLESLFSQDYQSKEIIVVDNGSQEDIRGMVAEAFPQARFIRLKSNHGFAGGYNRGIEAAHGKYVAIINNDAVASPQWVGALVEVAEKDRKTGAIASIIIDGNKPDVLDSCGVGMALDGMSRQLMRGQAPPQSKAPKEVLVPSGCACLFRADALKAVGLFDESFFAYCEDTDLGLRLRWAGFKTVVVPDAQVTHNYSMTAGKYSLQKVFWVERNHLWVAAKNFPFLLLPLLPFATVWRYIVQTYAILSRSGDLSSFTGQSDFFQVVATIVKAYLSAAYGMPSILRKRFLLMRKRRIGRFEMIKTIWHFKMSMVEVIIGSQKAL
ncbi:MAG: glycosyltransferase family 2 protein [Syntrophales bacterium]|jgi:GT2 family glycosyltransferase